MPFEGEMMIFSVNTYQGKKGLGANVVFINTAQKGKLEMNVGDADLIQKIMKLEGTDVIVKVRVNQSRFGDRIELVDVVA